MDGVVIIGAGAAGLMAAKELTAKGYKVTLLEAADKPGGRIHTIHHPLFEQPIEAGAEFIHGRLPVTLQLLDEAGIEYRPVQGSMIRVNDCKWQEEDELITGWDYLMQVMNQQAEDMTIAQFLSAYFADDKYSQFRNTVKSFAEGYDLADINKASLFALRDEWINEEPEHYRIPGGYEQLITYLQKEVTGAGGVIRYRCIAKHVSVKNEGVEITCNTGEILNAGKVIITVPLGVLQSNQSKASLEIEPLETEVREAISNMGFGPVIKIQLQFKEALWHRYKNELGFILSNEVIRTWWTQFPGSYPLLTGWLGGASAAAFKNDSDETILSLAITSLANIFCLPQQEITGLITASLVHNWQVKDFTLGGYSYDTLHSARARKVLQQPVGNHVYFAGEGLYEGPFPGTVEAALVSAKKVTEGFENRI
ncbi:flavin monoamine oxidase family protein [Foetidibacter luteolus]|uniref:flavin monoamine oxidase family protein n=1 Tax=Foetidibacter luteolus TaxID=2608880 RepID=UPI00129BAA6A|nr:NAD(P)/FAD-dependent oxidoreductase [Foetidibacter luteolus]